MPWTEHGAASCHRYNQGFSIEQLRQTHEEYLARSWFKNFIAKPPYEPGDKPHFDKGRFITMVARDHINGFGGNFDAKLAVWSGPPVSDDDGDENSSDADKQVAVDKQISAEIKKIAGSRSCGAILPATWQGGNKAEPSAKVARRAKSYEAMVSAARPIDADGKPRLVWDHKYNYDWRDNAELKAEKYSYRGDAAWRSYSDIRRHGKTRCKPDVTYAQAAQIEQETFLHRAIDIAAPQRRRQVRRQHETRLWQQERRRHQPRRLLYLLKQPRSWLEARILMDVVGWFLTQRETIQFNRDLSADKTVNCVSDGAIESSKERDGCTPKRRRHVFPTATEELELARRAKTGDPIARDRLLWVHWPLVHRIAKGHVTAAYPLFDLIHEGFIGLTKSFDEFDPETGFRFSTFAMLPVEWAILDYKRREQKKDMVPLDAVMVENIVDLGNFTETTGYTRPSRSISNRIAPGNITVHISPYVNGLAPETHDFIAELNAEANRLNAGVQFIGLKNRIEVTGDIEGAAGTASLVGWFLSRAQNRGYFQGAQAVLRRENSRIRKELRQRAKRKPK